MFQKIVLAVVFGLLVQTAAAQPMNLETQTGFDAGNYTVGFLLEEMNKLPGINITYNSNEIPVKEIVTLPLKNPVVSYVLDLLTKEFPLEYAIKEKYIILKKKKLASHYTVEGNVTDRLTGEPIPGVNVYVKESYKGSMTDQEGKFRINIPPGSYTLVFSYLGYGKNEVGVKLYHNQRLDVSLEISVEALEEVRVFSNRHFIGDKFTVSKMESINASEIERHNVTSTSDLLHGRFTGILATKISGAPGDHQMIRIRGLNSFVGGSDPLFVIDGIPVPIVNLRSLGIADINIHDIETITVLKDASSTALYGYQGANGVVLIDTKKGGKKKIEFLTRFGIQHQTKRYDLMSSEEFLSLLDSIIRYSYLGLYYPAYTDSICNDNWQEMLFRNGTLREYQLSGSGTIKHIGYYVSGNYFSHKGIVLNTGYERYTLAASVNRTIFKRLHAGFSYRGALQKNTNNQDTYGGNELIFEGLNKSPCYRCTPDSMYYVSYDTRSMQINRLHYNYPGLNKQEDFLVLASQLRTSDMLTNSVGGTLKVHILENLQANLSSTGVFREYRYLARVRGNYLSSDEEYIAVNQQVSFDYNKPVGHHEIKISTGYWNYIDNVSWQVDSFYTEDSYYSGNENLFFRESMAIYGRQGSVVRQINSHISQVTYSYKKKYSVFATGLYSWLIEGKNTRISNFFPSLAINWNLAQEYGFNRIKQLDYLNLFVHWGMTGNYPLNGLSNDLFDNIYYVYGNHLDTGMYTQQLANHSLIHERAEEYNFGMEMSLFTERCILRTDFYRKANADLILQRNIPLYYGGGRMFVNAGKIENSGCEFSLESTPFVTNRFRWHNRFGFTTNSQIVTELNEQDALLITNRDILTPDFLIQPGEQLGIILGYKYLGVWTEEDNLAENPNIIKHKGLKYFKNDTTSTQLSEKDKVILGTSLPRYYWSWYNSFRFGKLSLDLLWYAVTGISKYNATRAATHLTGLNSEITELIYDYPAVFQDNIYYESSVFVEDASFLRLRQVSLSYETGLTPAGRLRIQYTLSFENLVTFTSYKGYDPEATIYTDNIFSDSAIDRGAYPAPKGIFASIKLTF